MKKFRFSGLVCIPFLLVIFFLPAALSAMTVTYEGGSGTYDANTSIEGFTSETDDPTGPFSGHSVMFKGTEIDTGQYLTYRYRIEFPATVNLKEIILQGVAFCGNTTLKILDANMNEIDRINMWGGNSFQTFLLVLPSGVNGSTFYLEEEDDCPNWRYRSNIKVITDDEPLVLKKLYWWNNYIVHAEHEDGSTRRWTGFTMQNENNETIADNIVSSVKLYDPDGIEITPLEVDSEPYRSLNGRYISDSGKWEYDDFVTFSGEYYVEFHDTPLKTGLYRIEVTDTDGNTHEAYNYYKGKVDLPFISSDTFRGYEDASGNFIWTWSVPYESILEMETQVRPRIKIYNNETYVSDAYFRIPTHLGKLFIPQDIFQKIKAEGNIYKAVLQLRERSNRTRTYSTEVPIEQLPPVGYSDINGDGKTGLEEAIHCLKVVSDVE